MTKRQSVNVYVKRDIELDNESLLLDEALFHNANGYLGIRSAFEEGYPKDYRTVRGQYINGFDFTSINQPEVLPGLIREKQTMVNVAGTQSVKIHFENEVFSMFEGEVLDSIRWVDMEKGVTGRYVLWRSPGGKEVEITIKRMASFYQLSLFTIEYQIKSINFSGEVKIESNHYGNVSNCFEPNDPRIAQLDEPSGCMIPALCSIQNGASFIVSQTSKSKLQVCSCVKNFLSGERQREFTIEDNNVRCEMTTFINEGGTSKLIKYAVFSDSLRSNDCKKYAASEMKKALSVSIKKLYKHQEDYLTDYWENCFLEIEGDDELNIAIKYNLFQLIQSVTKDEFGNIAPKGLSGEGYEGQYFWDSEMYIQPFFTITNPEITKNLISYRYEILERARENAKIMGHKSGALFPWRTIMGKECSGFFPAGSAQYHINGDIAYSIIAYYLATKDMEFILEKGAEIIFETARLWIDTGNFYEGKFHINDVTGPDEYTCIVNNNYFTNQIAKYNLKWAVKLFNEHKEDPYFKKMLKSIKFKEEEIKDFENAANNMFLPYDEKLKINPQDDSFLKKKILDIEEIPLRDFPLLLNYHPLYLYRYQVCKQPDTVLAHFIMEDEESLETIRNSFEFYEKITTHDSSLSESIFCIMAARLGMEEKAYEYFGNSTQLDLLDLHKNTKDGIHTANIGGNYMAIVYGFGGFRLKECGICFSPMLPDNWQGYRFRISYEKSRIMIEISSENCTFFLEKGEPKKIHVYGKEYLLESALTVELERNIRMRYEAVIFDLDGVVCHTDKYHYIAWGKIASELGMQFDEGINNRLRGVSRSDSLDILLEINNMKLSGEQKQYYLNRKNEFYLEYLDLMTPKDIDQDVIDTLVKIRSMNIKTAIGSSSKNAKTIMNNAGIKKYFDAVSDGTNINNPKPDPEVFLKAGEFVGVQPEKCLVVEDSKSGLEAAINGKMDCAAIGDAVNYGLATYDLNKISDILKYL